MKLNLSKLTLPVFFLALGVIVAGCTEPSATEDTSEVGEVSTTAVVAPADGDCAGCAGCCKEETKDGICQKCGQDKSEACANCPDGKCADGECVGEEGKAKCCGKCKSEGEDCTKCAETGDKECKCKSESKDEADTETPAETEEK